MLTRRFLSHLEASDSADELHSIVAITFTDRAAREMRDRIREACGGMLENCAPDDVPRWIEIIRGLDSARISTIHSFCMRLLRAHAVDAGLDPRFGLLDPAGADMLLRREVSAGVREALSANDADCLELVFRYGLEKTREHLRKLVLSRFQVDFRDFADLSDDELVRCWYSDGNFKRLARARELAAKRGVLPINIALAFVLCQPFPTHPLIGPRNLEELRTSLPALNVHLTTDELTWLNLED